MTQTYVKNNQTLGAKTPSYFERHPKLSRVALVGCALSGFVGGVQVANVLEDAIEDDPQATYEKRLVQHYGEYKDRSEHEFNRLFKNLKQYVHPEMEEVINKDYYKKVVEVYSDEWYDAADTAAEVTNGIGMLVSGVAGAVVCGCVGLKTLPACRRKEEDRELDIPEAY